uniref:TPM domain-containing protein n=1 Tax=Dunaliella tertiolecta TaxID=3047 RepID=A0A7S3VPW7_DUNTE|mmetsp:Transcript_7505/g.19974  ORF Transcript_7505/g.19974 Transcript_7505/m.19974 type:complete len:243 (+) Transcript_7505:70-798(+)|eukprot:CAMPEP_0202347806 /NCGR_PEP_ID=MMETSP1126-20121109/6010_1 /ASSEMBLY_ACC=CAM_ASM_000457 /TAXON_ID=3047 /ORGANISM="Dunaliella tertiolecta, Strain CCMP1320" /LENGTH=242 /DNA_ID=CAMNT_0048939409 /DNA_START=42 /DNA_END=770 /DNA_ORIENTATION=-
MLSARLPGLHLSSKTSRPVTIKQSVVICKASRDVASSNAKHQVMSTSAKLASATCGLALAASLCLPGVSMARPEGVNRPDLLPKEQTPVIDVAGFLTPSEEARIRAEIESLELDTGFKLRVLAQNYPETPGKAIADYWGVGDDTIVFVADPSFGDILNFNVGGLVDLEVPRRFWGALAGKYGNKFYWQEKGENESILNAVSAIDTCLREPQGRFKCTQVQGEFGEKDSKGPISDRIGKLFGN